MTLAMACHDPVCSASGPTTASVCSLLGLALMPESESPLESESGLPLESEEPRLPLESEESTSLLESEELQLLLESEESRSLLELEEVRSPLESTSGLPSESESELESCSVVLLEANLPFEGVDPELGELGLKSVSD